ncbi:MAG: hypothetical protein M5U33_02365 [Pseudorhodoplanes sp.]|nr:hypothetical protein [Pseudorhodoplanes sp.]
MQRFAAAIGEQQAAIDGEFIALGVAAEIVMIVEDEDARLRMALAVEIGRRKPADAAADHDKVVALLHRKRIESGKIAVAQRMGGLERAVVMAAQASQRGRIAAGRRKVAPPASAPRPPSAPCR